MNLKKSALCAIAASLLILPGCGKSNGEVQDAGQKLFTVGSQSVTKGEVYELLKHQNGANITVTLALQEIYNKEAPVTDEMKKAAEEQYKSQAGDKSEEFEKTLIEGGYKDKQEYIDEVLVPAQQAQALFQKYFKDHKDDIISDFKPSIARILQFDKEENAKKAIQAIKDGTDPEKAAKEFGYETASYTGKEETITNKVTTIPERLVNALCEAKEPGVIDEVVANDDNTSWYVGVLVSNNYEDNYKKYAEALGSESTLTEDVTLYYFKEYDFKVTDQWLFDYFRANMPKYLVTRPDLSEAKSGS